MRPALRLSDATARADDNILPLRHLAALLVLYGHGYALAYNPQRAADVVAHLMPGFYAGNLAVYLFFAISGFLVTASLIARPGVLRYARNRVLRVYPAYLACLLLCVFALGPAFTTLPIAEYLQHAQTWDHLQQNLLPISFAWSLPGVFEHNPVPHTVNGTLWSLGLEVRWYFYLGVLAALTIVRRRWAFTLVAGMVLAYGMWEWWIGKPDALEYRALSQTFLCGALAAHWRRHIRVSHVAMAVLVALAAVLHGTRAFGPVAVLAAMYFCAWFAYRLPAFGWPKRLDASYGLFLYGFPVQQAWMSSVPTLGPLSLLALSLACALPVAWLSWACIERPALRWKTARAATAEPAP